MGKSNNPPYSVLELDKQEHEYLVKLFSKGHESADVQFKELCAMSSEDERANYRSILTMAATFDKVMLSNLGERLTKQHENMGDKP